MSSFNFTRLKMKATTSSVNAIKSFVDIFNAGIVRIYGPLGETMSFLNKEYPILVFFGSGVLVSFVPVLFYTQYKRSIDSSARHELERERVRLCLEKGIDPYPMIRYKEHVHGNTSQLLSFSETDAPEDASYEHRAVENMRKKAELYAKVMGIKEGTRLDSTSYEDPNVSLDSLLALRERERKRFNNNKLVVWQDPVDLVFPPRDDELYSSNAVDRKMSPAEEKSEFKKKFSSS